MKLLVGAASIAIIAAVGYYFVGEYRQASAIKTAAADSLTAKMTDICDRRVAELVAWKNSAPLQGSADFLATKNAVQDCLNYFSGTEWQSANTGVMY